MWFGEPSKDIEVVEVGSELKEESDIVHCPSSCGIAAGFLLVTTDGRSLALTGHAVDLGRLTAVAAVSWGGAALAACAAAVVAAAVSAAAISAAVVAAATAFARAVAGRVVVAAATIAAAVVSTADGAAAVGAPVVAPERLGWRWDALLSRQSTRLCLSFSNLLGFAVRFLDFFFLTAVLPARVSLHVKLICCPPRFVCSTNLYNENLGGSKLVSIDQFLSCRLVSFSGPQWIPSEEYIIMDRLIPILTPLSCH